ASDAQDACSILDQIAPTSESTGQSNRILNGAGCSRGDSPIVPLLHEGKQYCSGTVIAPNVILTAAHCALEFSMGVLGCLDVTVESGSGLVRN
ncbi:MAG: trypsin-like serine protease, partial [Bdellovibrionales bacterium]|nr:trypsin-like serine protease [Bdellovibrionales bacterium]